MSLCTQSPCPDNDCKCTGTTCRSGQNCATCTNPCLCKNCCWHYITQSGYQKPLDISRAAGSWIYAYLSSAVASVKVRHKCCWCAGVASGEPINLGSVLELYSGSGATGTFIGRIHYVHVNSRQHFEGKIINKSGDLPWIVTIGQVPPMPTFPQTCYGSTHVHCEGRSEAGAVSRAPSTCNGSLSGGVSIIYSWSY